MGPGARGEGAGGAGEDDDDEEALLVVAVSAKLRNRLPCSRGPRGTSISPRDLPSCVTDAAERGRHACEEVGESTSRTGTRTTRALTPAARVDATRRRGRCWLEGVIFERKLGALKPPLLTLIFVPPASENYDRRRLMRAFRGGRDVSLEQGKKNGSACASAKEGCRREMLSTQRRSKKGRQRRWGDQKKRSQGGKKAPAFSTFSLLASAGSKKHVKVGCRRIKKARKTGPTSAGNAHQKERLGH